MQSVWFENLGGERFDLIVSNPPYIEEKDEHLDGVGVRYEPRRALASGKDGLDDIRIIVRAAPEHLQQQGWLLLEHGFDQGAAVRDLMQAQGFHRVATVQDLADNDRVTLGQWAGQKSAQAQEESK